MFLCRNGRQVNWQIQQTTRRIHRRLRGAPSWHVCNVGRENLRPNPATNATPYSVTRSIHSQPHRQEPRNDTKQHESAARSLCSLFVFIRVFSWFRLFQSRMNRPCSVNKFLDRIQRCNYSRCPSSGDHPSEHLALINSCFKSLMSWARLHRRMNRRHDIRDATLHSPLYKWVITPLLTSDLPVLGRVPKTTNLLEEQSW